MNVLLILASGKSSRFGGYPKAFCKVGNEYIVQRTVNLGKKLFDKIYLAINKEIYPEYKSVIVGCETLCIGTGQGDAHSFLRAARIVKESCGADIVTLCWGDTFFLDDSIFQKALEISVEKSTAGVSLSSIDPEPYAWYETVGAIIKRSCFKNIDGVIDSGIHDQSVFVFNLDVICLQLESFMKVLGINDTEDYINKEVSREMKLLDSFTYFFENDLFPMKYSLVMSGGCYSFNTNEELEQIRKQSRMKG